MFGALASALGLGKIGGALGSIAGGLFGNEFQSDEATAARDWSAQEALRNREWQERMSNTAYQRQVADMQAAGLNPMLAAMKGGGASTPSGGIGGTATAGHSNDLTGGMNVASAAQIENIEAQTDRTRAEAEEIRKRTPTHEVSMDRMRQDINESIERIHNIRQQVTTGIATAENLAQQTTNLRETVAHIRASTDQLRDLAYLNMAQAVETLTRSGLNEAHAKEVYQKIKENLPQIERALMQMEMQERTLARPGHENAAAAQSSFAGTLGAYLRAINPIQGLIGSIPMGPRTVIQRSEPRITIKK